MQYEWTKLGFVQLFHQGSKLCERMHKVFICFTNQRPLMDFKMTIFYSAFYFFLFIHLFHINNVLPTHSNNPQKKKKKIHGKGDLRNELQTYKTHVTDSNKIISTSKIE